MSTRARRYEGFDPRTRALRWALASAVVAIVMVATAPEAAGLTWDWLQHERERLPWYLTRASALLAYVTLTGSVTYGLLLSTGVADRFAHRAVSVTLHRDLAGVGLALAMVHAAVLMLDRTVPYTPVEVLVPLISPYRPVWIALGQLALGSSILITLSTYVRGRIGQTTWRRIHRIAFLGWAAATIHGLMAGSDSGDPAVALMYVGSCAIVAGLTALRLVLVLAARKADTMSA